MILALDQIDNELLQLIEDTKLGFILWEGTSPLNDQHEIVVVATLNSGNKKTGTPRKNGNMVQVWILLRDTLPTDAIKLGYDGAICGDCVHRGDRNGKKNTCYVNAGQGPGMVWKSFQAGKYTHLHLSGYAKAFGHRKIRFGAYGDPACIPPFIVRALMAVGIAWTGYTHQWRKRPDLKSACMASVDNEAEYFEAKAQGWRTFRVKAEGEALLKREIDCCNYTHGVLCIDCCLCDGTHDDKHSAGVKDIAVDAHGGPGVMNAYKTRRKLEAANAS